MAGNGGYWLLFIYVSNPAVVGSEGAGEWSDLGGVFAVCAICAYSTFSMKKLKRHIFVKHEVEKHKPCPHCEFKSPDSNSLDVHIDRKHPEHGEIIKEDKIICKIFY